ncbi:3-oxoacid CoA-transferase subunit B [Acinetobacter sp. ANC 5414]|uniref:3-oxoacid CoA-transferase subunit B n=1 Tax=Acinetobacter sp. ANC 5414 TaxID=2731251 RepID=UPI00148FE173|nr:3-oxoacid CoA-transferase subunit B [Acinetobacter sp. ANC 5414]NNH01880.1 3-oxoacid CoA-transferase subunit B [Acinetobacter sp. ANC 5414]
MSIEIRNQIAARVARDIPEGAYVNLGIGLPTLVANHFDADKEVFLHTENGILGRWVAAEQGHEDWDLINAGKEPIALLPGASFFHHADSFGMMRGGHLDICVLGAYQVSAKGDLANWHTDSPNAVPAVGGAMDLAVGAKKVYIIMELLNKKGESKLLEQCSYPVTGLECVSRVYTDYATFEIEPDGVKVIEIVKDISITELQKLIPILIQPKLKTAV